MRVLVTGYSGQLGYDVVNLGKINGLEMIGASRSDFDITDKQSTDLFVRKLNPDVIIHCAAYTAVDKAEDDRDACWDVNVTGTENIVNISKEINARLMYISTDYVFNGDGSLEFRETDNPDPIGYYGYTKYQGEKIVQDNLEKWFIVRISWVFGVNGNNFIKTMLRLAETKKEVNVVSDQYGSPTYTHDVAKLLIEMIQTDKYGIYHATNEGICNWAELAVEVFKVANIDINVNRIKSEEFPTRAVRPKNSRLSKQKLIDNGFSTLPSWQSAVKRYLETYLKGEINE